DFAVRKRVVLQGREVDAGQRLDDLRRGRSLDGEERIPRAGVHRDSITKRAQALGDPVVILHDVRRVDDDEEVVAAEPVHDYIVNEGVLFGEDGRVLRVARLQLRGERRE